MSYHASPVLHIQQCPNSCSGGLHFARVVCIQVHTTVYLLVQACPCSANCATVSAVHASGSGNCLAARLYDLSAWTV